MTPPIGATKKASPLDYKSLVLGLNPASDPNLILQVVKWVREQADTIFGAYAYTLSLREDGLGVSPNHRDPALCSVFTKITGVPIDPPSEFPDFTLPFAPLKVSHPFELPKPTCRVCGMTFEGVMGYVCTRNDCPSGTTCG